MTTIRDYLIKEELALDGFQIWHVDAVQAYGTSEGVSKAWDSRGRGKNKPQVMKNAPKPGTKLTKKVAKWAHTGYEAIKSDEAMLRKIHQHDIKDVKGIALRHAWFAKRLGDLMQSWTGFHDLVHSVYKVVESLAKVAVGVGGAHEVVHALHAASAALHPVIQHIVATAGSMNLI